jgi:molecular chaperone HtpG
MTREELIKNLGTIAKSGTKEFMSTLSGDKAKDSQLIGQFGVGFYSSFIISDKVVVTSRKAGMPANSAARWTSKGEGEYEIEDVSKRERGTEIVMHLKDEETEFLNSWKLRHIITKYSDHVGLPVIMKKDAVPKDEKNEKKDEDIIEVPEEEVVNKATALWTVRKEDIKEEEYKELYKHIAHDFEDPLTWSHNKVEGKQEYTTLLYLPARAPFDMWNAGKAHGLKLYVQRVFIMDDAEQFLPNYLRFVRGVVDSNDLPLNISREILQGNKTIDSMRASIIKRVLSMLEGLVADSPEKYEKFWKEFGQVLKEGPAEDFANKERIAKLLRFASTHNSTEDQNISLEEYVSRMKDKQEHIYYVSAETFNAARHIPHLEIFKKKGIEVLLLSDRVDEWLMSHLTEFSGKKFKSIAKGGLELGELADKDEQKAEEEKAGEFKSTLEKVKGLLKDQVKDVRITNRLTSSPSCIVADEHGMTPQMERIMRAAGQFVPYSKPILELNPDHLLIQKLKEESDDKRFEDFARILFDQAILAEGGQLNDPASFVKRFNELLLEVADHKH